MVGKLKQLQQKDENEVLWEKFRTRKTNFSKVEVTKCRCGQQEFTLPDYALFRFWPVGNFCHIFDSFHLLLGRDFLFD